MNGDIEVVDFQSGQVQCSVCNRWTLHRWGLPTFNGDIVSNDFPDELWHEGGGGIPACERCYKRHAAGRLKTCDHYYLHLAGLSDGAGI